MFPSVVVVVPIKAQRASVKRFAEAADYELSAEFVEAHSGKGADALDRSPPVGCGIGSGRAGEGPVTWPSSSASPVT